ncbi:PREDICTED: uncharacterized protein LOC106746557 [Dinoponera quadriceps]|uniref:Uncharacterized protein LOC106746557 n=1 Tax=Dinoponera quadriceps TaxID=609295 RepID=A0A6P3XLA4_DINQU|nr:PREDICTED: uncharacterized protein LOC106746557 [Dinoponera quadriceps]
MLKFCPLCIKNGVKNRIKAFQINLEEAMWSCENSNCVWPLGYEDLTKLIFQRSASTCTWEDTYLDEECTPTLIELTLYTPPMTPLECSVNSTMQDKPSELSSTSESIDSKREIIDCKRLPNELAAKFTKEKDINANADKPLPKIVNIEKVNIDITKILQDKHPSDGKMQEHLSATSVTSTAENYGASADIEYYEFNSHKQYKTGKECKGRKNDNVQRNEAYNLDAGISSNIPSVTTNMEVQVDIINNPNNPGTNGSTLDVTNTNDTNIDTMLDDILENANEITKDMSYDWLDFIQI